MVSFKLVVSANNKISLVRRFGELFEGQVTVWGNQLPRAMVAGVLAVICLYVGTAGIVSTAVVPFAIKTGDTRAHVDYIWRIYNGEIPRLSDGIQYQPFNPTGSRRIQPQANHPPLFYAINAPLVGPYLERGEWEQGIAVARWVNVFIGVLCVLALAWAGWLYGGRRGPLFAVALPAIGALTYRFTTLNIVYGADALLVLFATLTFVVMYKFFKHGVTRKYLLALGVLAVLGMSTKAGYLPILAAALASLVLATYLHAKKEKRKQLLRAGAYTLLITLAVAAVVGWFYYVRNYQTSGTWFRATPDEYSGGRVYQSLSDVVFGARLRGLFYEKLAQNVPLSIVITTFAAAGFLGFKRFEVKRLFAGRTRQALSLVLLLALLGVVAAQITFAVGYGSINFRYLLPVLVPIGLVLAYGLLEFKWARGQFVAAASILLGATTILPATTLIPGLGEAKARLGSLFSIAAQNGVHSAVLVGLFLLFLLGAVLLVVSLYKLTAGPNRSNAKSS